jgi:hypothetical protein
MNMNVTKAALIAAAGIGVIGLLLVSGCAAPDAQRAYAAALAASAQA